MLGPDALRKSYGSSGELKQAIMMCMRDADQTLRLMIQLQALPLALQISQVRIEIHWLPAVHSGYSCYVSLL